MKSYKIYCIVEHNGPRRLVETAIENSPARALSNFIRQREEPGHYRISVVDSAYPYADYVLVEEGNGDLNKLSGREIFFQVRMICDPHTFAYEDWRGIVLPDRSIS